MKKFILLLVFAMLLVMVAPVVATPRTPDVAVKVAQDGHTECNEDLTGETFTYYLFGDLSGPFAFISQPLLAGLEDATAYFNERGGVCGAEIEIEFGDTGGSQDKAQEFWDEFTSREEKPYMMFMFGSADAELVRDQAVDLQIPILLAAGSELALYGENGDAPAWTFAIIPLYTDQLGNFCNYVSENWDSFGIEGDPVIGHLSWEGAFGRSSDTEATRAYCESKGVGYAGAEYFLPTTSDVSTQLDLLVGNGANIIYTTSLASGPANVAAAIAGAELGDQVVMAGTNWALDTSVMGLGGLDTNGIVGSLPYMWWDELDNPGIQIISNSWAVNRYLPAGDDATAQRAALATRNIAYLLSFAVIDGYIEFMTQAINTVGYENLNGAAIYDVFNGGFDYSALGGVLNFSYNETNRANPTSRIGQIQFVEVEGNVLPTILPLNESAMVPDLKVGGADVVGE
ncbi:MAG: ABC transporter substrate-binding protein [Anaerolineales bacterium]|nr:ABC transporter substrate-binding protein [Anaerolineales bacterium]